MLGQWLRDRFAALQRPLQSGTALLRQHRVLRQREHGTRLNPVGSLLLLESLAPPPLARCGLRDTLADIRPCLVLYLYIYPTKVVGISPSADTGAHAVYISRGRCLRLQADQQAISQPSHSLAQGGSFRYLI